MTGSFRSTNGPRWVVDVGLRGTKNGPHLTCHLSAGGPAWTTDLEYRLDQWLERSSQDGAIETDLDGKQVLSVCNHRARRAIISIDQTGGDLGFIVTSLLPGRSGLSPLPDCDEPYRGALGKLNRPVEKEI